MIGIWHPARGEEVAAADVLKPDVDGTTEELRDFVKPDRRVHIRASSGSSTNSPKGPPGKALKRQIAVSPLLQAEIGEHK